MKYCLQTSQKICQWVQIFYRQQNGSIISGTFLQKQGCQAEKGRSLLWYQDNGGWFKKNYEVRSFFCIGNVIISFHWQFFPPCSKQQTF